MNSQATKIDNPVVSVVLPFYRPGEKLDNAVRSVVDQDFGDWELILVNNNACNISEAIAEKWVKADPRVRVVHEPVQSVSYAMNTGLRHTRAGLVARMDADDISLPDRLRKQVKYMNKNQDTGVVSAQTIFNSDIGKSRGFSVYVDWQNSIITHKEHYLSRFIESPLAQPTIMFRKNLTDLYGYYNTGNLPEDYEMWLRWLEKGVRFHKIPEPLVQWNDHKERLTRTHSNYSLLAFRSVRYEYLARWIKNNISPEKKIIVCGSSRNIRSKTEMLSNFGVKTDGFTDIKVPAGLRPGFISYGELTDPKKYFILNLVSKRGVGQIIRKHFLSLGFTEGTDFLLAG